MKQIENWKDFKIGNVILKSNNNNNNKHSIYKAPICSLRG